MKIRKYVYLVMGILLVLVNLMITIPRVSEIKSQLTDPARGIGYLIGTHFLLIIGVFLLYGAYRVQKKIKRKEQQSLENAFLAED
ncbi:hypothetical protein [Pseudobacter ginsenosidimutans]|uniref:Uncharacterized protein n=1 Tax=Pseudobacter ginsenosidimutans TaxID=661488 RepID=A0A4Q7MKU7_9BACT|nr:hypothetical protein [Pseudobacter ginsenosidimutans]QEC40365.1 hypothetical protein FSB84_01145 [Pseudobacter ginsenosidimutans]RZS69031.1 hypothetical protein EV199_4855 [Pseudobacter ginsenosidimutans]